MSTITIKRRDTQTALQATLISPSGQPANLTGASVRFIMVSSSGAVVVNRPAIILDALAGVVRHVWDAPETDVEGFYTGEFEVTGVDGRVQTYPNDGYLDIRIIADLA